MPKACLWVVTTYKYLRSLGFKPQTSEMKNLKSSSGGECNLSPLNKFAKEKGRWSAENLIVFQWIHTNKRPNFQDHNERCQNAIDLGALGLWYWNPHNSLHLIQSYFGKCSNVVLNIDDGVGRNYDNKHTRCHNT